MRAPARPVWDVLPRFSPYTMHSSGSTLYLPLKRPSIALHPLRGRERRGRYLPFRATTFSEQMRMFVAYDITPAQEPRPDHDRSLPVASAAHPRLRQPTISQSLSWSWKSLRLSAALSDDSACLQLPNFRLVPFAFVLLLRKKKYFQGGVWLFGSHRARRTPFSAEYTM